MSGLLYVFLLAGRAWGCVFFAWCLLCVLQLQQQAGALQPPRYRSGLMCCVVEATACRVGPADVTSRAGRVCACV